MTALPTARILAAELLKGRKRWLPYVLLLPIVAALAFQVFLPYFVGWRREHEIEALYISVLPWSLASLLDLTQFLGAMLIGILAASVVGTEHGWRTVHQALARGQPRSSYLTTKLLGIAIFGAVGLVVVFAMALLFSAIVTAVDDRPITFDVPDRAGLSPADVALMALRASYGILPYVLLAFCLAVVGRSTTLGSAGVLVYMFLEAIVLAVLSGIGGVAADARAYFIGHNVMALLAENQLTGIFYFSLAPRGSPIAFELPDPMVAAMVLALYCAIFLSIAYWVFLRRDLSA